MKNVFIAVLFVLVALSFTGCGGEDEACNNHCTTDCPLKSGYSCVAMDAGKCYYCAFGTQCVSDGGGEASDYYCR